MINETFPCFLLHLSLASLSVDSSILACKPERRLPRRLLFSCLGLCGAVQNVVVLKILKTVHRAKRSPSGTDLLSCSLALWSGFSALSGVMARARVYGFSVIWSAIVLYKCLHCRCASTHCLLCRVRFGCVGLLMIIAGKDKKYEIKIKTAMQLVWTPQFFSLFSPWNKGTRWASAQNKQPVCPWWFSRDRKRHTEYGPVQKSSIKIVRTHQWKKSLS